VRLKGERGLLHVMPAWVRPAKAMGLKAYSTVRGQARFCVLLFSSETGELLAMIEADRLGQVPTSRPRSNVATSRRDPHPGSGEGASEAITLFESQGIAMEDVAVAKVLFERAAAHGVGQLISTS